MPQRSVAEAPNPLREGLRIKHSPEPCVMVIFGSTGDLTHRKLLPALYNLALEHPLPAGFSVIGFARRPYNDDIFRKQALDSINQFSRQKPVNPQVWESFESGIYYLQSDFNNPEGYTKLAEKLNELDRTRGTGGNRIYYLSTPPSQYPEIIQQLGAAGLNRNRKGGWTRIIIEKPFGHDLASAKELNRQVAKVFREDQVYRIDHYLGKETVQNILVFRFANGIFEPIWNRRYVDHVQITVAENIGLEGRAAYYEESGAIRDMVQNHVLQLLTLVAMEPPVAFDANEVRDEKVKVLHAIQPLVGAEVLTNTIRAQYGPGWLHGEQLRGYREEPGVSPTSLTDTYVAMKIFIDSWRWAGVPFYLRTGKHLPKRVTEIAIQFKQPPLMLFKKSDAHGQVEPNILTLRIQPDEGISLKFGAKVPGSEMQIRSVNMDFFYGSSFVREQPEAYERLLLDCMLGDSTLFTRHDEVETAWNFVQGVLDVWKSEQPESVLTYEPGTWGPQAADEFIWRDGRRWRRP
ncbi:MAG TPA: glucose-6-phosphate dehydrogenase [Ktedonobacteraceae bacterium]|nr:glucose-6-phosphate dehydrogenase [Ktedonobacteraceae bacterium]